MVHIPRAGARGQTKLTAFLRSASSHGNSGPTSHPPKVSVLCGLQMKSGGQRDPGLPHPYRAEDGKKFCTEVPWGEDEFSYEAL